MTFYELEKECKKRRVKRLLFIGLIFSILIVLIYFLSIFLHKKSFNNKTEVASKEIKNNFPDKNKTKVNYLKKKEKIQKKITKDIKFLPLIDLNITQKKIIYKKREKKKLKKSTKNQFLITQNIPSFETCINIANKYLLKKDYKNALKWAKLANRQNKKDARSWIISAKALYYSGSKEKALKLLKIYNSYYNNKDIEYLIKEFDEK